MPKKCAPKAKCAPKKKAAPKAKKKAAAKKKAPAKKADEEEGQGPGAGIRKPMTEVRPKG